MSGLANGLELDFEDRTGTSFCFPLFFCGEKGLKEDKGAVVSNIRGFERRSCGTRDEARSFGGVEGGSEVEVDGNGADFESFLYSLYLSAR